MEFFESGGEDVGSTVLDGDSGVLFVKKHDGRATGDAFVMFATEEEGSKALAKRSWKTACTTKKPVNF